MRQAQIFISYRRDDTAGYARAVYDELAKRFGADRVFIDVDDIGAGLAFSDVIQRAVGTSKVLLVLIGRRWRGERPDGMPPRIREAGDFVRQEVAAGLAGGMRVIPVLLDGATMPTKAELPTAIQALAERNAIEINNSGFAADIDRLATALYDALGERPRVSPPTGVRWVWRAAAAAVIVCAGAALWWQSSRPARPSADAVAPPVAAALPDVAGQWQADVTYDWPGARYVERFVFAGEAGELHGSASFLGVPRAVLEAKVDAEGLRFSTRTGEIGGAETVHRYRGRLVNGELRFVMQTEGGSSPHMPIEFVARRVEAAASAAAK
jgi:hypothetical protein